MKELKNVVIYTKDHCPFSKRVKEYLTSEKVDFKQIFENLQQNKWNVARSTAKDRISKLKKLKIAVHVQRKLNFIK